MSDDYTMVCEGSGQPCHETSYGAICAMCGHTVNSNCGVALFHTRQDVLAMIEDGVTDV